MDWCWRSRIGRIVSLMAMAILMLIIGGGIVLWPIWRQLTALHAAHAMPQTVVQARQDYLQVLRNNSLLLTQLPNLTEHNQVSTWLLKTLEREHLQTILWQPGEAQMFGTLAVVPLQMELVGRYANLLNALAALQSSIVYTINRFDLTPQKSSSQADELRIVLQLSILFKRTATNQTPWQPKTVALAAAKVIDPFFSQTAITDDLVETDHDHALWSQTITDISLVGIIGMQGQYFALLQWDNGLLSLVPKGEVIAKDGWQVVHVGAGTVELVNRQGEQKQWVLA